MNILSKLKNHKYVMAVIVVLVVLISILIGVNKNNENTETEVIDKKVVLIPVSDYQSSKSTISANGTIESLEQAELKSQIMAPVSKINTSIGSSVSKGQVLVVLQNNDLIAQLNQAKAALKAQETRLEEMKKGTRLEELKITENQLDAAKTSLENTTKQQDILVENARKSLFNSGLTAIPVIGTSTSATPTITGTYTGTEEGQYNIKIYVTGDGVMFQTSGLENTTGLVNTVAQPLGKKGLFIQFPTNQIATGNWTVNIPNTQAASYNANKNAYEAAIQARQSAIDAAKSAVETAQATLDLKNAGATNEQIKTQEAAVEQAQASVDAINAQLQKTVITAPISGTVSAISVKYGELITAGQSVVSIVNKSGLQIKAYISGSDLESIEEGANVDISENVKGIVNKISPSVDSKTKSAELNILVIDPEKSELIVGQNVSVKIETKESANGKNTYSLPLQAVGISSDYSYVYIVDSNSNLEEVKVTTGAINGENIEILNGLTSDMKIVSTVYELKKGQKVVAQ